MSFLPKPGWRDMLFYVSEKYKNKVDNKAGGGILNIGKSKSFHKIHTGGMEK